MVNNPLASHDQDTMDSDIAIGKPLYENEGYSGGRAFMRIGIIALVSTLFVVLAGGLYFYAYQRGLEDGQKINPPVIAADPGPHRLTPDQAGIEEETPPELNIYEVAKGTPPDINDGSRESLLAEIAPATPPIAPVEQPEPDQETAASPVVTPKADEPSPDQVKLTPPPQPAPSASVSRKPVENKQSPAPAKALRADGPRFMVQIAATRSRALARSTYAAIQKQHTELLGARDPLILRVDLGEKGVFYRINLGGFDTRGDAQQFCNKLKTKGQDCLVKNEPS